MRRHSRKKGDLRNSSSWDSLARLSMVPRRYSVPGRVVTLTTYLPRPVAKRARREIYTYPYPNQKSKRGRTIRLPLTRPRAKMVKTKVRIRLPEVLPLVRPSYVSVTPWSLNIHSRSKLRRLHNAKEFNRRRYSEYKGNKRKARNGQLDSRGSRRFGSVAEVMRKGGTIDEVATAALAARAIAKGR